MARQETRLLAGTHPAPHSCSRDLNRDCSCKGPGRRLLAGSAPCPEPSVDHGSRPVSCGHGAGNCWQPAVWPMEDGCQPDRCCFVSEGRERKREPSVRRVWKG